MRRADEMFVKLLEMNIIQGNEIRFDEEAKNLISEIAEESRDTKIYKENAEREEGKWIRELGPEEIYKILLGKVAEAPTILHAMGAVRILMPLIDEKLKTE